MSSSSSSFIRESALVAAGIGNSREARRLRVKLQRRDRYGRWVEMGGALSFVIKDAKGMLRHIIGHAVGGDPDNENNILVMVKDSEHMKDGVYSIGSHLVENIEAEIGENYLSKNGIRLDVNGSEVGNVLAKDAPDVASLARRDITEDDLKAATGKLTASEVSVVKATRDAAAPHISANADTIGERGHLVPEEHAPASPHVTRIAGESVPIGRANKVARAKARRTGAIKEYGGVLEGKDKVDETEAIGAGTHGADLNLTDGQVLRADGSVVNTNLKNADGTPVYDGKGNLIKNVAEHNRKKSWTNAARAPRRGSTSTTGSRPKPAAGTDERPDYTPELPIEGPDKTGGKVSKPDTDPIPVSDAHLDAIKLSDTFKNLDEGSLTGSQKRLYNDMVNGRNLALQRMREATENAGDIRKQIEYNRQWQIASAYTAALNKFADGATKHGRKYSFSGSVRREAHFIIPGTVSHNSRGGIEHIESIVVAKNGKVFKLIGNNDSDGVGAYEVRPDGSVGTSRVAYCSVSTFSEERTNDPISTPSYLSGGKDNPIVEGTGIASALIDLNRLIKHSNGKRFQHSDCLTEDGASASKWIDPHNIMFHDASQRERVLWEQRHPMSVISKNAGFYGSSFLSKLELGGPTGGTLVGPIDRKLDNSGRITKKMVGLREMYRANPSGMRVGRDYPELFADFIEGKDGAQNLSSMVTVLANAGYTDGPDNHETARKLRDFSTWAGTYLSLDSSQHDMIAKLADGFDDDKNFNGTNASRMERPADFDPASFAEAKDIPSLSAPTTSSFRFDSPRSTVLDRDKTYVPSRSSSHAGKSEAWTDSPQVLAERFSTAELTKSAHDAITTGDGSTAILNFGRAGGADDESTLRTYALYHALKHQGADADMIFAQAYDAKTGDDRNVKALEEFRNPTRSMESDEGTIDHMKSYLESLDLDPATVDAARARYEAGKPAVTSEAVSDGASMLPDGTPSARKTALGDPTKEDLGLKETNVPGASTLRMAGVAGLISNDPIISDDASKDMTPFNGDFTPAMTGEDWRDKGVTDNPIFLARNFYRDHLEKGYTTAIASGNPTVKLKFASGNEASVDVRAIRDALQHQNVDTNHLIRKSLPSSIGIASHDSDPSVTSPAKVAEGSVVHSESFIPGDAFSGTLKSREIVNLDGGKHFIERYNDAEGNHTRTIVRGEDGKPKAVIVKRANGVQIWDNPTHLGSERNGDATLHYLPDSDMDMAEHKLSMDKGWLTEGVSSITGRFAGSPEMSRDESGDSVIRGGWLDPMSDAQRASLLHQLEIREGITDETRQRVSELLSDPTTTKGQARGPIAGLKAMPLREGITAEYPDRETTPIPVADPEAVKPSSVVPGTSKRLASEVGAGERLYSEDGTFIGTVRSSVTDKKGDVTYAVEDSDGKMSISTAGKDSSVLVGPITPEDEAKAGAAFAARRASGNKVLEELQKYYPGAKQIEGSEDLVIASKHFSDSSGNKFRYDAIVHRSPGERFHTYARRVKLDASGNEIAGTAEVARLQGGTHSAQALRKHITDVLEGDGKGVAKGILAARHPGSWFSQSAMVDEVIHPATGQKIHPLLLSSNDRGAEFIGTTGIRKTGSSIKDALVGYVANQIDRGVSTDDIINTLGRDANDILTHGQIRDLVERVSSAAETPGVSSIAHLERGGKHIVMDGDIVIHHWHDSKGNPTQEINKVMYRIRNISYDKDSNRYTYSDIVQLRRCNADGTLIGGRAGKPRRITTGNIEIIKRANGEAPESIYDDTKGGGSRSRSSIEPHVPATVGPYRSRRRATVTRTAPTPATSRSIPTADSVSVGTPSTSVIHEISTSIPAKKYGYHVFENPRTGDLEVRTHDEGELARVAKMSDSKFRFFGRNEASGSLEMQDFDSMDEAKKKLIDFVNDESSSRASSTPKDRTEDDGFHESDVTRVESATEGSPLSIPEGYSARLNGQGDLDITRYGGIIEARVSPETTDDGSSLIWTAHVKNPSTGKYEAIEGDSREDAIAKAAEGARNNEGVYKLSATTGLGDDDVKAITAGLSSDASGRDIEVAKRADGQNNLVISDKTSGQVHAIIRPNGDGTAFHLQRNFYDEDGHFDHEENDKFKSKAEAIGAAIEHTNSPTPRSDEDVYAPEDDEEPDTSVETPEVPTPEEPKESASPASVKVEPYSITLDDGKAYTSRSNSDGSLTFYGDGNEVGSIAHYDDGTASVTDPFSGDTQKYDSPEDAERVLRAMIEMHRDAGMHGDYYGEPEKPEDDGIPSVGDIIGERVSTPTPDTHTAMGGEEGADGTMSPITVSGSTDPHLKPFGSVTRDENGDYIATAYKTGIDKMLGRPEDENKKFGSKEEALSYVNDLMANPEKIGAPEAPASVEIPDTHTSTVVGSNVLIHPKDGTDVNSPSGKITFDPSTGYKADYYEHHSNLIFGKPATESKNFRTMDEAKNFVNGKIASGADSPKVEAPKGASEETEEPKEPKSSSIFTGLDDLTKVHDLSGFKKVVDAKGFTSGGIYEDSKGNRIYVKEQSSPLHADNEILGSALYEKLGIPTTQIRRGTIDGKDVTFSEMLPGAKRDLSEHVSDKPYLDKIYEGFAGDAWLANWDTVGPRMDNIVSDADGNPVRVDAGGSLLFKGSGSPKGSSFGNTVGELDSLTDRGTAKDIFSGITSEQKKDSAKKLLTISDADIDKMVKDTFGDKPEGASLAQTLKNRKKYILDRYGLSEDKGGDGGGGGSDVTPPVTPPSGGVRVVPIPPTSRPSATPSRTVSADSKVVDSAIASTTSPADGKTIDARTGIEFMKDFDSLEQSYKDDDSAWDVYPIGSGGTSVRRLKERIVHDFYENKANELGVKKTRHTSRTGAWGVTPWDMYIQGMKQSYGRYFENKKQYATMVDSERSGSKERREKNADELIKQISKSTFAKRIDASILIDNIINNDEKFVTQFITGTSRGFRGNETRATAEVKLFGLRPDIAPRKRPVYGLLVREGSEDSPSDLGRLTDTSDSDFSTIARPFTISDTSTSALHYGDSYCVFDEETTSRATFTLADSLGPSVVGVPATSALSRESLGLAGAYTQGAISSSSGAPGGYSYPEAQVHGGNLTIANVKYIVAPRAKIASIQAALDAKGLGHIQVKELKRS